MKHQWGVFFTILICMVGCSSPKKRPNSPVGGEVAIRTATESPEALDSEILDLEHEIPKPEPVVPESPQDIESDLDELPTGTPAHKDAIPSTFNNKVADWVRYFSQKDRERFQRYLDRGEAYREVVENILEENNVPADLYYLGLIESGFNHQAKSTARAVGVWQFMKSSGKDYGLNVDSYLDDRKDPIRATEAAAKYLRDLYRQFGSWYLALAAYNAGPGRIRSSIRRAGTNDFWKMVERKKLPRETMEYVPKFLAARYIGEHPDLFAFYINEEKRYPDVESVKVPSPVRFATIEQRCSIPEGTLSFVNPHYTKGFTHPNRPIDEIWVPLTYKAAVERQFAALKSDRIVVKPERVAKVVSVRRPVYYTVKRGDTLRSVARKQGLSVAYLKRVNGLRSSNVHVGQKLKMTATEYKQRKSHPRHGKKRRGR